MSDGAEVWCAWMSRDWRRRLERPACRHLGCKTALWAGQRWMIGVSIEMTRQLLGWSRTTGTGTLENCHSLLGRWVRRRGCALHGSWNATPVRLASASVMCSELRISKSAMLQLFEPAEDAGSSWHVPNQHTVAVVKPAEDQRDNQWLEDSGRYLSPDTAQLS